MNLRLERRRIVSSGLGSRKGSCFFLFLCFFYVYSMLEDILRYRAMYVLCVPCSLFRVDFLSHLSQPHACINSNPETNHSLPTVQY